MTSPRFRRGGFTLIELLVTIGIISVIAGLILPAVQAAREAARRIACRNNLKQLALAMQGYEGTWSCYPPSPMINPVPFSGGRVTHASAQSLLLPWLEQRTLFDELNFATPFLELADLSSGANQTASTRVVSTFLCISDPVSGSTVPGSISYRANAGVCEACPESGLGAAVSAQGVSHAGVLDGLAHTIAFSEKPIGAGHGGYAPARDWISVRVGPAERSADGWYNYCASLTGPRRPSLDSGHTWLIGGAIYTHFFTNVPPNGTVPDCGDEGLLLGTGTFTARSYHPGGVNAAMMDGSVSWVSSTISRDAWRSLGTARGGELAP